MNLVSQQKIIDGLVVTIQQLPAMTWMKVTARLGRTIAPSLLELVDVVAGVSSVAEMDHSELVPILAKLFENLDDDRVQSLTLDLLSSAMVQVDGAVYTLNSEEHINIAFTGRPAAMIEALAFSFEVNGFFVHALEGFRRVGKFESTSTSPATPT